jgi:hypothetical protein
MREEDGGIAGALQRTDKMLQVCRLGLSDFLAMHQPERKTPGLYNLVVYGRAVTNVLQTIRTFRSDEFDAWYEPIQSAMSADPLMRYFYKLRSSILKEGLIPSTQNSISIDYLNTDDVARLPRPPYAAAFFIGDQLGGSGWELHLPDGTVEKYYIALPPEWGVRAWSQVPNPPSMHKGAAVADTSLEALAQLYVAYLEDIVRQAHERFEGIT